MIVNEVVGRIDYLAEFRKDDRLLALEMLLLHVRRAQEIGDQFGKQRRILCKRSSIENGLVASCPGIDHSADVLDRFGDLARIAPSGTLEHHMLDDMSEPVEMIGLGAGPNHRIKTKSDRFRVGERVDRDREAI